MDSFEENTEVFRMKRNFSSMSNDIPIEFDERTRQKITFDETPLKARKASDSGSVHSKASDSYSRGPLSKSLKNESIWSKKDKDSDSVLSKREVNLKTAEVVSLKAKNTELQERLNSAWISHQKAQIEHEKEISKIRSERERNATKMGEFHSKLNCVMAQEKQAREELKSYKEESAEQLIEMKKRLEEAQKKKREAEAMADEQKEKWHKMESSLHDQIIKSKKEIISLQSMCSESKAQLTLRERRDSSHTVHAQEVEELKRQLKSAQDKAKSLEGQLSEHADDLVITKALKTDLDLVPKMKNDLEKLRLDNEQLRYNEQNCLLLEEEVRGLKSRLVRAEEENLRLVQLEVVNEELQGRLQRWEAFDESGSRRPQSPSSLSRRISLLETSQAEQTLKEGELQTKVNSVNYRLQLAQKENQKLSTELQSEKNTTASHADLIKRLRRKVLLLSKERDSFKELLDSYESELTVNVDAQRQTQIERQEAILHDYKQEVATLEVEVARLAEKCSMVQDKADTSQQQLELFSTQRNKPSEKLDQELRISKEKVIQLEEQLAKTEQEKDILEARIEQRHLQGDYDPSKTKILHFSFNPAAVAQQRLEGELERLRTETERLRKRNQILEECGGGDVNDLTMQVDGRMQMPSPSKELEKMKEQLKTSETTIKRLKEIFKKRSQELREVMYELTGYKIDIPCSSQYKLTNMYMNSSRDYLLFQEKEGKLLMLETDFSKSVQDSMEQYLIKQNSIPVFLSNVTLDLFSQQTMM